MTPQSKALNKSKSGSYHLRTKGKGEHRVYDKPTGVYENYFANKYHASAGLKYKNTHLEFASSERHPSSVEKSERRHIIKHSKPLKTYNQ